MRFPSGDHIGALLCSSNVKRVSVPCGISYTQMSEPLLPEGIATAMRCPSGEM
jgi:hypothetical protein